MKKVTKSLTALLLALVMSLTLLPTQVLAAESAAKPRSYTVSYTNPLYADIADSGTFISTRTAPTTYAASAEAADTGYLTTRAAVIEELRSQMIDRQSTIVFKVKLEPGTIDLKDWWQEAISHVTGDGSSGDFLRWQFKSYGAGATPEKFNESWTGGYEVTYTVMWYTTSQQETQLNSYIKTTILPQLALGGKTTYQKVQAIYNWITKNVRYDYAHLNDSTYKLQYTAYAAAINKTAVCQGYANLFYRLANDAGIDCRIITGTADGGNGVWGPHAWNIVKMDDGNYYCLDATWDEGRSSYSYFLKGTAAFNEDHLVDTGEKATYFWSQYPVSNTDFAPDAPAIPAAPRVTIGNSSASGKPQLTWAAVDGAAKYEIYRSTQQSTGYSLLGTTTSTSYVNTGAAAGKTYYYRVKAVNSAGTSAYSNIVSGRAKAAIPAAPRVTIGNSSASGKPQLTWAAVDGAAKYEIYRSTQQSTGYSLLGTTTSTSYVNTGAAVGKTYYYRVKAVNSAGTSAYSNIVSGTARTPAPAAPVLKGGTSSASGKPQLTWAAVDGAAKYDVYRSNSADGTFSKVGSTDKTTYVNTGAVQGVTYFYKIRAVGASGASGFSNTVAIHVAGVVKAPAAVALSGIKADAAGITVTWKTTANADTYNVLRRDASNTAWKVIARGVSGTSYKDTTVARGVMYSYTVQGVAADGVTTGPYDTTGKSAKVTASASTTPGYVTMKDARRVTIGEKGILLTWTTATNAKTYNVYRAANPPKSGDTLRPVPASKWVLVAEKVSALSWKDTTGTSGTTYAYMVRGVAADGKTLSTSYNTVGVRATMPCAAV